MYANFNFSHKWESTILSTCANQDMGEKLKYFMHINVKEDYRLMATIIVAICDIIHGLVFYKHVE